ncbi:helix-turn-helix transcriptional regulator [Providencia rettgeri]|uniref:XRE family transcriptional regulator n=1 Tax=Providencia rettgeri TaxID=587 RepID=UPI001B35C3FA|nr:helix-turn-helix transcriptional regulator [Providencia rettgeri]MBQ0607210.1 helix-turn-helix transcriptional regulator [Providencia rettgeri]MCJ2222186.1 helix-turn-helix transcriptional regulator [Providencia rettgeri]MDY0819996.1 helix-turn-helix transcriptional regulator [Providencia rettgeri]
MKTTLAQRLKQARQNARLTQNELAKLVGVSQAAIQKIETGKAATSTRLIEISKALNVDPEWLSVGTGDNPVPHISSSVKIELADDVSNIERYRVEVLDVEASAGKGVIVIDDFIETITSIEYSVEEAKRLFGGRPANTIKMITVRGDSMAETFEPRDQIFVDMTVNHFDGDGIYVFILNNQLYIKRLQMQYKRLAVISDNPKYETWYLDDNSMDGMFIHAKVLVSQSIKYKYHG